MTAEEPKYPIGGYAPGNYMCNCVTCKSTFQGDKRAVQCETCAIEMVNTKITVNNKETVNHPILIIRNDDNEEFIHLGEGLYRTKWGILNNSIAETPLNSFDKSKFTFYYGK
jgi:hypothetical protein